MEKYINKFHDIIDKIGKQNFVLIIFIFVALLMTGLYQTFSLYTESEGLSIVDGIKTYKFILDASNNTNSVTIAAGASKNLEITVSNESATELLYGVYYSSSSDLTDVNMGYVANNNILPKGTVAANDKVIVTVKIDNLSASNATISFGLKYGLSSGGDLTLDDGQNWMDEYEEVTVSLASYVQSLYNDGSTLTTVNIGGSTDNPSVSLNATQGIMLDNNGDYRYYGANPNNYVSYNGELWRIISSSNVKSSSTDTVGEQRIKLIRAESIGSYSWDGSVEADYGYPLNDWTQADLMTELNTLYYNKQSGTCYNGLNTTTTCDFTEIGLSDDAKNMIESALWYLGDPYENYSGESLPSRSYKNERGGVAAYEGWPTEWEGIVGLMYPSDYFYASDLNLCDWDGGDYAGCKNKDWLGLSDTYEVWTISPQSGDYISAYSVFNSISNNFNETANLIYPTVYLKSDVMISGGTGTSGDPYQLSYTPLLSQVEVGSYVAYTGNNGCSGNSCSGQNANYVDDTDMGYCNSSGNKFTVNGWRIGYIENGSVYLVSAGAPECMCTDSSGNASSTGCTDSIPSTYVATHINNLDSVALKYCNSSYALGGICDGTTAWAMDDNDFQKLTSKTLTDCYTSYQDSTCGYGNNLIDNGGRTWFASYNTSNYKTFNWYALWYGIEAFDSVNLYGVRPVIKLDSTVYVTGGSGTYTVPYTISN